MCKPLPFLRIALTLSVICGFVFSALGESTITTDSLRNALNDLQQRIAELQKQVGDLQSVGSDHRTTVYSGDDLLAGRDGAVYLPKRTASDTPMELPAPMTPVAAIDKNLKISGYMDAVYTAHPQSTVKNQAALNQVDIDLLHEVNDRANVGLSLFYTGEFSIAAATFNYLAYKAPETTLWDPVVTNWTVTAGRFDIPFGLDYKVYTSIARETITMPKVVSATHGGWNDVGLMNSFDTRYGNMIAYAVRGFTSRVWASPEIMPANVADDDANWRAVEPSITGGIRYNATPFKNVDLGFSAANSWSRQKTDKMNVIGLHAQSQWGFWSGVAEAIQCQRQSASFKHQTRGYYAQSMESLGRLYLLQRYDFVEDTHLPTERFVSAGLGFDAGAGFWLRSEYQWNKEPAQRTVMLQIAAGF